MVVLHPLVAHGKHRDGSSICHSKQEDVPAASKRNDELPERRIGPRSHGDSRRERQVGQRAERGRENLNLGRPLGTPGGSFGEEPDETQQIDPRRASLARGSASLRASPRWDGRDDEFGRERLDLREHFAGVEPVALPVCAAFSGEPASDEGALRLPHLELSPDRSLDECREGLPLLEHAFQLSPERRLDASRWQQGRLHAVHL